jgi:hypothetical protein
LKSVFLFRRENMPRRSLSEVLADFDVTAVTVDANGRVGSADPKVAAQLRELREVLADDQVRAEGDPVNLSKCYCGGGTQSGCEQ